MKKKRMMKYQAIMMAACVALSTFDMTAFATTTSADTTQTEVVDTGITDETSNIDTISSTDSTQITTEDTNNENATEFTVESEVSTDETVTDMQDSTTQTTDTTQQTTGDVKASEEEAQTKAKEEVFVDRSMSYHNIEDLVIPSIYDGSFVPSEKGTLPASYSSVTEGYITPVRNQGSYGTCWSFAAMGMAEANIVKDGLADNTLNLSELQLAYFFYHTFADPLSNTTGDSTEALKATYLQQGGNSVFTTFALASWTGAALESKAPYEDATSESYALDSSLAHDNAYHMQNAYWINMADREDVKTMIMNYGAVASAYYSDQLGNYDTTYYNNAQRAYYYNGSNITNHAIIIVGWDDSFSNTNFNTAIRPSSNGAWLVKNSWGTGFGNSGYFWISYEDAKFNDANSQAFVFDFESADNYDHNYQYDGTSGANSYNVNSGGGIANIFTASGNSTGAEQIDAVSFALYDVNVNYSIQIYTDITDSANPMSGTATLATPKTGITSYVGYYTIPLDESVAVDQGEKFSVVVTLTKSNAENTKFFGDKTYQNSDWISFTNTTSTGQSFRKFSSSSSWSDLNSSGVTARIKAFTSDTTTAAIVNPKRINLNSSALNMNPSQTTTLTATVSPSNASDKSVTWSTLDSNVATVDSSGFVTAIGVGIANITATTVNGIKTSCKVTVTNNPTSISLNSSSGTMKVGETTTLTAIITPSNATDKSVTWITSNSNVATVSTNGLVTATGAGSADITATTVNGLTAIYHMTVSIATIVPTSITLNSNAVNMSIGNTTTITATVLPSNASNKTVTWSTSDSNVATVDSNGLVTAVAAGTATITGTTSNNIPTTCVVTVTNPFQVPSNVTATQISLNTNSVSIKVGSTTTLTATVSPSNATDKSVIWTTSNGNVATVDSNGQVTVTGIGTTIITATTVNGLTAFCQVTGTIGKVTGLTAASQTTKSIKLSWNKQNGVSGYEIYRYNNKKYQKIGTTKNANTTMYTNKSLKVATTYKYKVRAYTKVNGKKVYGSYSGVLTTSTKTAKPTLTTKALSKSAKLTWGKISRASGYEVYMSTKKSSGYSLVKTIKKGKTIAYTKKGLTKKTTYYYKIRAYKTVAGVKVYSNYSKVKSVKVK